MRETIDKILTKCYNSRVNRAEGFTPDRKENNENRPTSKKHDALSDERHRIDDILRLCVFRKEHCIGAFSMKRRRNRNEENNNKNDRGDHRCADAAGSGLL